MSIALLVLVGMLAYANGSNDNSKSVATLVGYGAATPTKALIYAAVTTAIGAAISFGFSGGLLKSFGTGLFAKGAALDVPFFICVLIGAFGWVIFATFTGLPVSTTHAITGALIGAGLAAKAHVLWPFLGRGFVLPLVLSPALSLLAVYVLAFPVIWLVDRIARRVIVREEQVVAAVVSNPTAPDTLLPPPVLRGRAGAGVQPSDVLEETPTLTLPRSTEGGNEEATAVLEYQSTTALTQASPAANAIHWLSGGLIGFARGWNDTPKIAALALVALPGRMSLAFAIVTVGMALGGLISARKVLQTLSRKLTPLPLPQSLTASLTTAALVCMASWKGLPVSTTHVSTGAIIGAGLNNDAKNVNWKKVSEIFLSWVITLPASAVIAWLAKLVI